MSTPLGIALLGSGIVGSGVLELLHGHRAQTLRDRAGVSFDVRHVVVRDPSKPRDVPVGTHLSTNAEAAVDDPTVQIVVELMGGVDRAGALVERALKQGKPVVTANKSLLAARGAELFALARAHKTCIAFEASCGGGIPIVDALHRGLSANRIDALVGIVNGTCNFILTQMTRDGTSYAQALKGAQDVGFAEADPTLDVSGRDAAQKLAILAGLAFGRRVLEKDLIVEGIDTLDARDIAFARELGYVIKLLAVAERQPDGERVALRVAPTLVHTRNVLAEVSGGFNAISVYGDALGHALFYGRGAGRLPTASAVVADLVSVATGAQQKIFDEFLYAPDRAKPVSVMPADQVASRHYLRLSVRDVPGTLARVTDALGKAGISLSAVLQHEDAGSKHVPVVIMTHRCTSGAVKLAIQQIDALDVVGAPTVCLRVLDEPKEFAGS
jgi:homoserine dehydrogenase